MIHTPAFSHKLTDEVKAIAAFHRSLITRLDPDPIPLITEEVIPLGQTREARLAAKHLASLSAERRAQLDAEWEKSK